MLALNIMLVIVGVAIPIGTAIFWSMVKKTWCASLIINYIMGLF